MRNGLARVLTLTVLAALLAGCASRQRSIQQHQDKLESLAASTSLLVDDRLAGQVSTAFTRTALDAIFVQVEQQRAALASTPDRLADARAVALSQQAEQLSRLIAQMRLDVARDDAVALRARRRTIPLAPDRR